MIKLKKQKNEGKDINSEQKISICENEEINENDEI